MWKHNYFRRKIIAKRDKGNWDIGPGDEGTCGNVKVNKNAIAPDMCVYGFATSEPTHTPIPTPNPEPTPHLVQNNMEI